MKALIIGTILAGLLLASGHFIFPTNSEQAASIAPRRDAVDVNFDWVLSEGELLLGTQHLEVPVGMNVVMQVDNDRADTLLIDGYDSAFELPPDQLVAVAFNAYKKGRYTLSLQSSRITVGTLTVVASQ